MKVTLILMLIISAQLHAATIAIIDSGVDVLHKDFEGKVWINPNEIPDNGRDEDGDGYQDDIYGWNFAEQNNLVIDRKYLGTFSEKPYKFFEIQGRLFLGQATEEDREWMTEMRKDKEFFKELSIFGNFVHGTHVAGISQNDSPDAQVLSVKLIPTEVKPFASEQREQTSSPDMEWLRHADKDVRMKLLKAALEKLAEQQMNLLEEIAHYVGTHKAQVANGSFGTGYAQAKTITDTIFKIFFFRKPTPEESHEVASYFVNSLIKQGVKMVESAPKTLFVFAAGNDGVNNDVYPTSPTNIQADNVISVAATYQYRFLAPFSNYGVKEVDVAAPGMLIHSQIPGNKYLQISGTSQAAPMVANVAARIIDINPKLAPVEIKKIIMGTTDIKDFLKDKIKTEGIVNPKRAEMAAEKTLAMSVDEAIAASKVEVSDVDQGLKDSELYFNANEIVPIALPSLFR